MKFQVGDYVKYSNKTKGMVDLFGIVIGHTPYGDGFIIKLDKPFSHYSVYRHDLNRNLSYLESEAIFLNPSIGYLTSKSYHTILVGYRSKNLKSGQLQYDPKQQGDRDDDV